MAVPGQVLIPSHGPWTVPLGKTISTSFKYYIHDVPGSLSWNSETLTVWKGHEVEEQHQDSHALLKALVRRRWVFSAKPRLSSLAWGLYCIWKGFWEGKKESQNGFPFTFRWLTFALCFLVEMEMDTQEHFPCFDWVSNPWQTRNILSHCQAKDGNVYSEFTFNQRW